MRRLVRDQLPQWRDLAVREVAGAGTVNAVFRIGDDLAARFPLQKDDPATVQELLVREAAATQELAGACPVATPQPVALGRPGRDYPLPWSVQTWLPGEVTTVEDPSGSTAFAEDLAEVIIGLRSADTRGRRFEGQGRGGHLPDHDGWLETCFAESEGLLDVPRLRAVWADLRNLPEVDADAMCHGDLTPPNVLVGRGRLVGVLDGGGFAPADPALDLVSAWHLLDAPRRQVLKDALGCSDVQWRRGMAWAFQQSMGLVWYYRDSQPATSAWGRRALDRPLEDS